MQIVLFEEQPEKLYPISMTRACFDIQLGGTTLYKAVKNVAEKVVVLSRPIIHPILKSQKSKMDKSVSGDVVFLNARLVPDLSILTKLDKVLPRGSILKKKDSSDSKNEVIVAARCPASRVKFDPGKTSCDELIQVLSKLKLKPTKLKFDILNFPWEVVQKSLEILASNVEFLSLNSKYSEFDKGIFIGKDVNIHPTCVLDTSSGSIILGNNVKVDPYAVLKGPLYIGPECEINSHCLIKHSSLTRTCKVGGELESVCMQAYTNKQHHGFLGHSYVGSWVNIGAGTTNSDLKNTYGSIKVMFDKKQFDTGLQFLGCIIGDFSKTAINCTVLTGKIVGVSSHLYGMITENVPSFTNYARDMGKLTEFFLESGIETQRRMFERRGIKQSKGDVELLKYIYNITAEKRRSSGIPKTRFMFK